ncbi:hypothetical protein PHLGIDRAFT_123493 [Phlebiopsis gigantea 11061_1 CR5-6]|uniref:Uncharacterized protein n=1 Tax=Phlebiopsis gigantea (strain 11061_1 CR5-6) TaxID=745531 RepID=A0A0C3N9W7_PHLG1|nr:hypothetical protein PHLGIDRAFT_123493 [Phlebiopsis gigantea 11061_1 CR5-6]
MQTLNESSYFIPTEYVNRFAYEGRGKQSKEPTVKHWSAEGDSNSNGDDDGGDAANSGLLAEEDPKVMHSHHNNVKGRGIKDVETLEKDFSGSNAPASITCYMSAYRRHLYIEAYFRQWEEDKYLNTSTFSLNNYVKALDVIEQETAIIKSLKYQNLTAANIADWKKESFEFFAQLGNEPQYNVHVIAYVELLQKLQDLETQ